MAPSGSPPQRASGLDSAPVARASVNWKNLSYGRTVTDVLLPDGANANQQLVHDGWCWWCEKRVPKNFGAIIPFIIDQCGRVPFRPVQVFMNG